MARDQVVLALALVLAISSCRDETEGSVAVSSANEEGVPASELRDYGSIVSTIEAARLRFAADLATCQSDAARREVLNEARLAIVTAVASQLFPQWEGTPWSFHGASERPRQGSIACGYFVSTVLRDAGFRVERARMAQQASELIIMSLTSKRHTKRFSDTPIGEFTAAIREWGPGLYVVGLDIHTGFILHDGEEVWFIHSSYVPPTRVLKEEAELSVILAQSRYRVLGKISDDDELIVKWLEGRAIPTKAS